tara:strand:+ start:26 stop:730 length:705 start_codon:yes stop_codon:yes gene_type:complete
MKIIILAGGFGTRLRNVVPDVPKPMANISGTPFLEIVIQKLLKNGLTDIIFSLHYKPNIIVDYFSSSKYKNNNFEFLIEKKPLGTGGAIKNVINNKLISDDESFMVLNGDTYVEFSFKNMIIKHKNENAKLTMLLRKNTISKRYGIVNVDDEKVISYNEKSNSEEGFINAGVYIMKSSVFKNYKLNKCFSLEKDFLEPYISKINANYFISKDYFIDIGIKEDYLKAQKELVFTE